MNESRQISDLARAELESLRAHGCILTDDDVVLISALCNEITTPSVRRILSRGKKIHLCKDVYLQPLTIYSENWWQENRDSHKNEELSLAYAMAHSYDEKLDEKKWDDVEKWALSLPVTIHELRECMFQVIAQDQKDETPKSKNGGMTGSELATVMHANHGNTIDFWERQVSIGYILEFLDCVVSQRQDDKACDAVKDRAWSALALALRKIEERVK